MTLPVKPRQRPVTAKGLRHQKPADPFDTTTVRSLAAEKALVAYLLQAFRGTAPADEMAAAREIIGTLGREMFTAPEAGDAFLAMAEAITADPPTVKDVVDAAKRQAIACGLDHGDVTAFIASAVEGATSIAAAMRHASDAAAEIRSLYEQRRFINAAAGAVETVRRAGLTPEIVAQCIEQLAAVEALVQRRGNGRRLVLTPFSQIEARPVRWMWPKRIIGGGLNIVTGPVGNTKSLFTIDLAARVTTGALWPDGTGRATPGCVIMFSAEDNAAEVIKPRMEAAGADMAKVFLCEGTVAVRSGDEPAAVVLEKDIGRLREALDTIDDVRLIVFDPLSDYLAADENSSAEVRSALMPLVRLAQEKNVAVVAVLHQNKKNDLGAVQRIAGSSAFAQVARCVLSIGDHPEDEAGDPVRRRVMLVSKTNNGERDVGQAYRLIARDGDQVGIEWIDGVVTMSADELIRRPSGGRQYGEKRGEAVDALREALADGRRPAVKVTAALEDAGFKRRQIDAAARTLEIVKRREADEAGKLVWFWWLPVERPVAEPAVQPFEEFTAFAIDDEWGGFK